jgi:MFS family permease
VQMKEGKVFYGYWVLVSCALCAGISVACGGNTISLFIRTLQAAMGWSRTQVMSSFTVLIVVASMASPFAGRLVDRLGARKVVSAGALLSSAGTLLLSHMTGLGHFYLAYVLLGLGATATGPVTLSYVVSQWFSRRRGLAVGVLAAGMAAGALVASPAIAVWLIPHYGWRATYLILGVVNAAVIVPLSSLVIKTRPAEMGLYPDGVEPGKEKNVRQGNTRPHRSSIEQSIPLKSALATSAFWLIGMSLVLNHTHVGIFQSAFPHLRDMGFSPGIAASTMSLTSLAGCFGMFFFGWLCDKIRPKYASAIGLGVIALSIVIMLNIGPRSPVALIWMYALALGFGSGSWLTTMSMLTSSTFGIASYGAIFGVITIFQNVGAGGGPLLAGYVYDTTHTYSWAFVMILAMVLSAIPLVLLVKRPRRRPGL